MKVKIIGQDGCNWSVDKDRKNLEYFLSKLDNVTISNSFLFSDIYYFVWYSQINYRIKKVKFLKNFLRKKIIAVVTNDVIIHRDVFDQLKGLVDFWISPNSKTSQFLYEQNCKYIQIPFYVSPNKFFKVEKSKKEIAKELNIPWDRLKDKMIIGSFQRDSLGSDLMSPKWEKGPEILVELSKKLKNSFILLLAGPRRHFLINECRKNAIPYLFIGDESFIDRLEDDIVCNNLEDKKINLLYNLLDVYIVSSRSEGGPKAIMEASLAETLIFSTDVGLAKDFLCNELIYSADDTDKVIKILSDISENEKKVLIKKNKTKALSILNKKSYLDRYKKLFEKI